MYKIQLVHASLRHGLKKHSFWIALLTGIVGLCLLWGVQEYIESLLPAIVSILALGLATYVSLRIEKNVRIKIISWVIVVFIAAASIYQNARHIKDESEYFDILSPNIDVFAGYDDAKRQLSNFDEYQLIDVIAGYYLCLKKPNTLFFRFPDWIFVFRGPTAGRVTEVRVSDSRLPDLPSFGSNEIQKKNDEDILMYMKFKVPLQFVGVSGVSAGDKEVILDIDPHSRVLQSIVGTGPEDEFSDVVESTNAKLLARARPIERQTDHVRKYIEEERISDLGKTIIKKAEYAETTFYQSRSPISAWKVSINIAIRRAIAAGASAISPGGIQTTGGPGVFRLFNGKDRNIEGTYWQLPFRVGIAPILVDAATGKVFVMDMQGRYSVHR